MPSPEYFAALDLCREQHRGSKANSGRLLRPHREWIKNIIDELGCASILDYGCGRGEQYQWVDEKPPFAGLRLEQIWGLRVTKYDPACPPFDVEPKGFFDLVICTHVLPLIPVQDQEWMADRLYSFARKALYIALDIGGSPKVKKRQWRPSGLPEEWQVSDWLDLYQARRPQGIEVHLYLRRADEPARFMISDAGLRGPLPPAA